MLQKSAGVDESNCTNKSALNCSYNNKINYKEKIIYNASKKNKEPTISYDTDGVMLWNGVRCESKVATQEEIEELEQLLNQYKD